MPPGETQTKKTHFERDTGVRKWQHPADAIIRVLKEEEEKNPIQIFTEGSRSERGVGSGVAIYVACPRSSCSMFIRTLFYKF